MRRLLNHSVNNRSVDDANLSVPLNEGEQYNSNSDSSEFDESSIDFHSGGSQLLSYRNQRSKFRSSRIRRTKRQMRVADKSALSIQAKRVNHSKVFCIASTRPTVTARQNQKVVVKLTHDNSLSMMACTLKTLRELRGFDTDRISQIGDETCEKVINVNVFKMPQEIPYRLSENALFITKIHQYTDKLLHLVRGSSCDQYRMYLITSLLPSQQDQQQPLVNRILPRELILRIFSFLDVKSLCRCARTCRYWNFLAMDGVNWQNVDLFRYQKDIKATVIESLAKRCGGFLKSLSLRGCENLHESCLRTFTAKCPNIEELSLQRCKRVTDLTCGYLGMNCSKLRRLDLENCSAITDKALMSLSECKRLEYLNIGWCEEIQDAGVRSIILHSPLLETLICRGCDALSEHVFMDMKEHMRELRHLNLMRCYVHDDTVADIANSCSHLEYLCLSMCAEITDRALISLGNGCPELRDLDLSGCVELTDHGFVALAKSCHQLERLDLADCSLITDTTLENFSKGCSRLKNLSLSHCELITDAGLRQFCLSPNLKDVLFVLELDNCPQITDASLDYIKQMRSLQRVDLYDCQNITKDAIKRFKACNPDVEVHAYFAPATPPVSAQPIRNRIFRCCSIL